MDVGVAIATAYTNVYKLTYCRPAACPCVQQSKCMQILPLTECTSERVGMHSSGCFVHRVCNSGTKQAQSRSEAARRIEVTRGMYGV